MNRRLGIPQRPTLTDSERRTPIAFDAVGDEATAVHLGIEEITVVGTVGSDDEGDEIVVGARGADGDEPTAEYPRRRRSKRRRARAPAEWYVRLRLSESRIAKLWVRRLAPLDVLVWWEKEQMWAPPLAVPEMRAAIAATRQEDAERARIRAELPPPPLPARPVSSAPPLRVGLQQTSWVEELRQRVAAESRMTPAVQALISGARRHADTAAGLRLQEIRPPPSSLPPMVVDVEPPQIPAAPRVPNIEVPRVVPAEPETLPLAAPATVGQPLPTQPGWALGRTERMVWLAAAAVLSALVIVSHFSMRAVSLPPPASPAVVAIAASTPRSSGGPERAGPSTGASAAGTAAASTARGARPAPLVRTPSVPARVVADRSERLRKSSVRGSRSSAAEPAASAPATTSVAPPVGAASPSGRELGGFDKGAARRALLSAAQRVAYCGEGTVSGAVVVTFSNSGFVQSASLTSLQGENVRADCVLRSFQAVRITPYDGQPVTVSKSFRAR